MKIKWNEYTWYSKWADIVFFLILFPILVFYIGSEYQQTKDLMEDAYKETIIGALRTEQNTRILPTIIPAAAAWTNTASSTTEN